MTTVVVAQSSPSSSIHCRGITPINSITDVDGSHQNLHQQLGVEITHYSPLSSSYQQQHSVASDPYHSDTTTEEEDDEGEERVRKRRRERAVGGEVGEQEDEEENWSVLALFVTAFRKSLVRCYNNKGETESGSISVSGSSSWGKMEIGIPTEVRHVAHVTFDRFDGFLGLPVEFEPEVPRRAPSASATVFGVSTNSMQLSFDSRGNSVPTILLMMQRRLYSIGGLEVEGIFRINAGNAQEEYVRDQLNRGVVPHDADVHCLAGLIKAWFRELPTGLLDTLSPEELMRCQTEEECAQLARLLPSTEASLLDWAVNLMADIAQHESSNKMNARNVAVVFAPNMTHVMDPLTALVHAVQVMNFLKTLITRTLREREDPVLDAPPSSKDHFDETDPQSPLQTIFEGTREGDDEDNHKLGSEKPPLSHHNRDEELFAKAGEGPAFLASIENIHPNSNQSSSTNEDDECNHPDGPAGRGAEIPGHRASSSVGEKNKACENSRKKVRSGLLIKCALEKGQRKGNVKMNQPAEKAKGNDIVSQIHTESDRPEAWR